MQKARILLVSFGATLAVSVATAGLAPLAHAQSVTEFTIPITASMPAQITAGPDGAMWFTEETANRIGRVTTSGQFSGFQLPTAGSGPEGIVAGPDGNLWFTENTAGKIGRITPAGAITEFTIPTANSQPLGIAVGSHGGLWFVEQAGNKIGKISPVDGTITEYPLPTANSQPLGINPGSDGGLWFTEAATNTIGRITPGGTITEYPNPNSAASVRFITPSPDGKLIFTEAQTDQLGAIDLSGGTVTFKGDATPPTPAPGLGYVGLGPDGAVWFVEQKANQIGRISTNGFGNGTATFQEFPVPTAAAGLVTLAAGPDGNLWFVEQNTNKIGRLTPPATTSPLVAAVLPASRSVLAGNTATAFATMINGGSVALDSCKVLPLSEIPVSASFQTTSPTTNALTGTPNTSVTIAAGAAQTFSIALTANVAFVPTNVILSFICKGVDPAQPIVGVNTLFLSASNSATPDVIALSATSTNDGIVDIPGTTGTGAFAVATANVGAGGAITASVDTGSASLGAQVAICQTNPSTAVCLQPPAASVATTINANAVPTFSIFVTATGAIPFLPGANRVFVRFTDAGGVVRGLTSVAVRTQQTGS